MKSKNKTRQTREPSGPPLKLYYDVRMLGHSGIGTQVDNVLEFLVADPRVELTLLGDPRAIAEHTPNMPNGKVPPRRVIPWKAGIYSVAEQFTCPTPPEDALLLSPHYNAPIRHLKRTVVVLHDLIHLHSREFMLPHYQMYAHLLLSRIAAKARGVLTVSEYTRDDFLEHFPRARDKTLVNHNGLNHKLFKPPSRSAVTRFRKQYDLPKEYLLVVGIGKRHKNIDFVIRSLLPLWREGTLTAPLVMGGTGGKLPEYLEEEFNRAGAREFLRILPRLPEEELPAMYGASAIFIMPSLMEGFGFPVAEAMACGVPVLSSAVTSLPEVGGNAATYFDPTDPLDFRDRLLEMLRKPARLKSLGAKGPRQAGKFSWQTHGENLIQALREFSGRVV